jgi:hypothetical protein
MKKPLKLFLILMLFIQLTAISQVPGKFNAGVGAGLDYGGFGAQFSFLPVDRVSLFGGLGYNLNSLGYNVGVQLNFPNEKRINFHVTGMYGYDAVLIVKGSVSTTKETYYGPGLGAGIILKSRKSEKSFWKFEVIYPFRSDSFHNDIDDLKSMGYDVKEPWPVAFSFGYHISLGSTPKR